MNDIYELALELCKDYIEDYKEVSEFDENNESDLEALLYYSYEINIEDFEKLINVLVPLIEVGKSPLTEKIYQGFAIDGHWLIKKEYVIPSI